MNAGEQLLNALGDGNSDPLALVKQQAMMKDNMNFHSRIVRGCFENCCKPPFKTKRMSRDEKHCIETCFGKMIASTLQTGQYFAEENAQQLGLVDPATQPPANVPGNAASESKE